MNVKELREKYGALQAEGEKILQDADAEGWTDELRAAHDRVMSDMQSTWESLERQMAQADVSKALPAIREETREEMVASGRDEQERRMIERDRKEGGHIRRLRQFMLTDDIRSFSREDMLLYQLECRQQLTTPGTAGGYLIPTDLVRMIETARLAYGGVRNTRATILQTRGGNPMDYPTTNDTGNASTLDGENTTGSPTNLVFGKVTFGAYKFRTFVAASLELLQDQGIANFEAWLAAILGERDGRGQAGYLTTGTGTSQPEGYLTGSVAGPTAAALAGIGYDDLVNLIHSVDYAYARDGEFGCNWKTVGELRKIKDDQGMPIWQSVPITEGIPGRLLGHAVQVIQELPDRAASTTPVTFGDMSKFHIRDAMVRTLQRSDEVGFYEDLIVWKAVSRMDSRMLDAGTNPVKHLVMPAT